MKMLTTSNNADVFPCHVDPSDIPVQVDSPPGKKVIQKSLSEIQNLIETKRRTEVKIIVRDGNWPVDSKVRGQLWPLLCKQHFSDKMSQNAFYWDLVKELFGTTDLPEDRLQLPAFVNYEHRHTYFLTYRGIKMVERMVCVLEYASPDITYSPTLFPTAAILLHFMSEDECYACLDSLVNSKNSVFIPQSKQLFEVTWRTVMQLTKKYVKSAGAHINRHCPVARSEDIYKSWIWWILRYLPFNHLVRVFDCYLHEGMKVLYRVAMALLVLFYKHSSVSGSRWAKEIQESRIESALTSFISHLPVSPRKLLRIAFGVRALSSSYIQRISIRTEMTLKSRSTLNSGGRSLMRTRSSDNLPSSQSQGNIQMMSHTLTIRELLTLWPWLPLRITMYQPVLLYTTEEHGSSLTTFYCRVEQHEPTLLMIKTYNDEIFGAYCSSRWLERNQRDDSGNRRAYFGTGETFLFSLAPTRAKYSWVGMDGEAVNHSSELFMAADSNMITIGGGEGQAIWMDENMRHGKTDHCLTFNNPPLCDGGDFEIRVLEVFGFTNV